MLKIMVTSVIPTKFQKGSWGGWLRFSTLLALVPLVAGPILGTPTFAQESKATAAQERKIETDFEQGSKTYPAHILLDRVAIVLADEVLANADLYREVIKKLGGKPILGLSRNIIGIAVPDAEDVAGLRKFINELIASRPDLIKYTVDTGILVTFGASERPSILTDKIIVQIADENEPELIDVIAEKFDAEIVRRNPFDRRSFVIKVPADNALEVSNEINKYPGVSFAHPNLYRAGEWRQASVIPNDEFFEDQWHLHNNGQGLGTEDADVDIDLAWSFGAGSSDIIIAVIDSGFETDHPDLADALWTHLAETAGNNLDDDENGYVDDVHGWDFSSCPDTHPNADPDHCGDKDVTPDEPLIRNTHGTAVAGAALARAYNGPLVNDHREGVVGTCPNCRFLPVRISVPGPDYTHQWAIQYAQSMGADVINISWGYSRGVPAPEIVENAINDAATEGRGGLGAVIFVAMTNESYDNCNPSSPDVPDLSSLPNVIAVGGSTNQDQVSPGGFGDCLDVLAPTDGGTLRAVTADLQGIEGKNFLQQNLDQECDDPLNRNYTFCFGGLSFSAPLVAGVAGLILSLDDSLTRLQVQRLLQDTADKISDSVGEYSDVEGYSAPESGALPKLGYGRINAFEAVRTIADPFGGRGGVDIFLRDNGLDWGNTEQPSSVTFEQTRGFIAYWQSADIKVDAPPFRTAPPATSVEFDSFVHESPTSDTQNQIYVRVHNRGIRSATNVRVKLLWAAHASTDPPALPDDFWSAFTSHSDASDTSIWHPLPPQTIADLPYSGASVAGGTDDGSVVLTFDFHAPVFDQTQPNSDHFSVLAIVDSPDDPVSAAAVLSQEPSFITPRDNNVSQLTIPLSDSIVNVVVLPCDC